MINLIKKILGFRNSAPVTSLSKKEIAQFLSNPNPTIIEAGASSGEDTLELAQCFPKGIIYAFEPLPISFNILEKKLNKTRNVKLFELALSTKTEQALFNISSNNSSSSLLQPKEHLTVHPEIIFETQTLVNTITLDDFAQREKIEKVDFMWLDMQGMEYEVLKASNSVFPKVDLLYTEVSLIETYKNVPLYKDFRVWLEQQGFEVIWEGLYWNDMGNVLFKRRDTCL